MTTEVKSYLNEPDYDAAIEKYEKNKKDNIHKFSMIFHFLISEEKLESKRGQIFLDKVTKNGKDYFFFLVPHFE